MNAIEIRGVTKQFGSVTAVNDLTLDVPKVAIDGFIGPNGSGKTTTIRMIMNIILPDSGVIRVLGRHGAVSARDEVGYLPEERSLYKKVTVRRLLRYYGRLKGRSLAQVDPVINRSSRGTRFEEKMSKINEVLLGSVTPFQLLMGKLLGDGAVALLLALVYFVGGIYIVFEIGRSGSAS